MAISEPDRGPVEVRTVGQTRTVVPAGIVDPVASARAELKAALAAIEIKGNLPRREWQAPQGGGRGGRAVAQRDPGGAAAVVAGAAATVGAVVWAIARAMSR